MLLQFYQILCVQNQVIKFASEVLRLRGCLENFWFILFVVRMYLPSTIRLSLVVMENGN